MAHSKNDDPKSIYHKEVNMKYEDVLHAYDKALELDPDDSSAWLNKGFALDELGRYEQALQAYDKALELDTDDFPAWNNIGIALRRLGRYEEALQAYDKALELDTDDSSAWYKKGITLGKLSRYEEALQAFDKTLEIDPDFSGAWANKGVALYKLGRYPILPIHDSFIVETRLKDQLDWCMADAYYDIFKMKCPVSINDEGGMEDWNRAMESVPGINKTESNTKIDEEDFKKLNLELVRMGLNYGWYRVLKKNQMS